MAKTTRKPSAISRRVVPIFVTVLLLGGLLGERLSRGSAEEAEPYHQQVRAVIEAIPHSIMGWESRELAIPASAIKLLRPNAMFSRQYESPDHRQAIAVLVVHCRDARDMGGHYPPVCYPSQGWTLRRSRGIEIDANGVGPVQFAEYQFARSTATQSKIMSVYNVLVLPDGVLTADIDELYQRASDYRTHYLGAGQIQVIITDEMLATERDKTLEHVLEALRPTIEAIGSCP